MTHNAMVMSETLDSAVIEGWVAQARREGEVDCYAGKRQTPRYQWLAPVIIQTVSPAGAERTYYVHARDISLGGIGLRCSEALAARAEVRVYVNDGADSVFGMVRYCTPTVGGYLVGIEFVGDVDDGSRRFSKSA